MPGVDGLIPASLASPARVRRCESRAPSATRKCGLASVTTVSTTSPGRTPSAAVKCTSRPSRARPESRPVAASLLPFPAATSSSTCRPTSAWFSSQLISSCSAVSRRYRSWTTSLGSWPSISAAGVPGRLEYWKVKALANRA